MIVKVYDLMIFRLGNCLYKLELETLIVDKLSDKI